MSDAENNDEYGAIVVYMDSSCRGKTLEASGPGPNLHFVVVETDEVKNGRTVFAASIGHVRPATYSIRFYPFNEYLKVNYLGSVTVTPGGIAKADFSNVNCYYL